MTNLEAKIGLIFKFPWGIIARLTGYRPVKTKATDWLYKDGVACLDREIRFISFFGFPLMAVGWWYKGEVYHQKVYFEDGRKWAIGKLSTFNLAEIKIDFTVFGDEDGRPVLMKYNTFPSFVERMSNFFNRIINGQIKEEVKELRW